MQTNETISLQSDVGRDSIALALSGGGSRAIAFHLGCLRALKELQILDRVSTITAVSGGSVLAGMYCSHPGDFETFEREVRRVLAKGFVKPALYTALTTTEGLKAIGYATTLFAERAVSFFVRRALKLCFITIPKSQWPNVSPILRKASRTTILRNTFSKTFDGCMMKNLRKDRPRLIVIACELRAKAAFYFTAECLHCWRYGSASSEGVELAEAVVASAAYPAALPAIDQCMTFNKNGEQKSHRITLTDGGVYDNLGLAPLWPDRDPSISMEVEPHDRIIACRAGYALEVAEPASIWPSRMEAAFESVFARSQNFATKRLFDLAESGKLKGILLPYLGQQDDKLQFATPDLVPGEMTAGYPTNFSAMDQEWIEKLVTRGEQLVYALVKENWPEMSMPKKADYLKKPNFVE
ncbi:patatin-like phospholipase family protein [Vreelandella profundi]|uniref:patatin-like phospholipase family protein n=1 Tax=Vreelandella profundi TaxID=2852117 RepID=UPI001F197DB9|nr:patatin-like phospholipase family protein [Halomonas profundi]